MHARATRSGETDEGALVFDRLLDAANEALTHNTTHAATHEFKFKCSCNHTHVHDTTAHHYERVGLAGGFRGLFESLRVFAAVFELQRIHGFDLLADIVAPALI